jgi:Activator of Hsp90 ATPase homolog 1-like protein
VTVDFLEQGRETAVVLTHERLTTPERQARAGSGWQQMLQELYALVASPDLNA